MCSASHSQSGVHCPYAHGPADLRAPTLERDEVRVALLEREMLRLVSLAQPTHVQQAQAQAPHEPAAAALLNAPPQSSLLVHSLPGAGANGAAPPTASARATNGGLGVGLNGVGLGAGVGIAENSGGGGLLAVAVARSAELVQRLAGLRAQLDHDFRRLVGARSAAQFDRADEQHAPLGPIDETQWAGAPRFLTQLLSALSLFLSMLLVHISQFWAFVRVFAVAHYTAVSN